MTPHDPHLSRSIAPHPGDSPEPSADRVLARTLDALDAATPPPGLESRLHQALQARAAAEAPRFSALARLRQALTFPPSTRLALLASVLVAAVLLGVGHRHRALHLHPTSAQNASTPIATPPLTPAPSLAEDRPPQTPAPSLPHTSTPLSHHRPAPIPGADLIPSPQEQAALDDLRAPSHPAPPMPLTAQERLIRRMMRRGEGPQLAQLDATHQASFARAEQTAFHEFFDSPLRPLPVPQDGMEDRTPAAPIVNAIPTAPPAQPSPKPQPQPQPPSGDTP